MKKTKEELQNNIDEEFLDDYEDEKHGGFFRKLFFTILLFCIIIVIYSRYVATSGLIIKEYTIENKDLPQSFNGFKIAHFSDFHYGRTTNIDVLKHLVKEINLLKPDIVVFTGDFIDKDIKVTDDETTNIINTLSNINSTYGNYYITGNHDIKFNRYDEMFNNANFSSLDDKFEIILSKKNESILISGTDYKSNMEYLDTMQENEIPNFKINIMHIPDRYDEISTYNYDLVLAGHSHNGQVIIPFYGAIYTPNGAKKYYKPHYKFENTDMLISSGVGTSGYNYRLFNRPSFNFYRLNSK